MELRAPLPWLVRRDERFHQLVELAPDGILIHDGERVVAANAAAHQMAGASRADELVGYEIGALLKGPFLKGVQSQLVGSIGATTPAPPVRELLHRLDGRDLDVEVRAIAFLDGGRPAAHLVLRDITDRLAIEAKAREANTRLQQAQKMETVGALSGGVAHEVNNMMQVILGYGAELLERHPTADAGRREVEEILRAAGRAASVTRQLLAFSRRAVHHPELFDLSEATRAVEPMLRRLVGETHEVMMRFERTPPVWMDHGQLEQVLVNLTLNARDATPPGGTLAITASTADLHGEVRSVDGDVIPSGRYASLRVQDSGMGMDAATRARAFEPFFTTKPLGQGTGLGLAAVHGILSQNGGFVALATSPGHGTTFTLYLPAPPIEAEQAVRGVARGAARRKADWSPAAKGETILVVDDEPAVRAVAARVLRLAGYRVTEAANADDAIALLEQDARPRLILTDVLMPGATGADLAKTLRARWPSVPVVFMSGFSGERLRVGGTLEPEDHLVEKPFEPSVLLREIALALAETADRHDR